MYVAAVLFRLGVSVEQGIIFRNGMCNDPQTEEELNYHYGFVQTDPPFTWEQFLQMKETVINERGELYLRRYRNQELVETDWVETPYNQRTLANLDEWLEYRQKLRDLPDTITKYIMDFNTGMLDLSKMDIPKRPQTIRKSSA